MIPLTLMIVPLLTLLLTLIMIPLTLMIVLPLTLMILVLTLVLTFFVILPCHPACVNRRRSQLKQVHPFTHRNVQHFRHPLF